MPDNAQKIHTRCGIRGKTSVCTAASWLLYIVLISACSNYVTTVNERTVLRPAPLLKKISVADPALERCIQQTITDQKIRNIEQYTRLQCSYGGIISLAGIQQLYALTHLDLSHNDVINIDALMSVAQLAQLKLDNNDQLACDQISTLIRQIPGLAVTRPQHCITHSE